MSSPDGASNKQMFTFNMSQQSVPTRRVNLNNTTFVTVPANMSQSAQLRPVLLQAAPAIPVYAQTQSPYQVVISSPMAVRPRQRIVHFKVNAAGEYIIPGNHSTLPRQPRPLTRRPLKSKEKVLCSNCGIQSSDPERCESCKKALNGIIKTQKLCGLSPHQQAVEDGLRATREEIERKAQEGVSTSSFYNGGGESDISRYVRTSASASSTTTTTRLQRKRPILIRNTVEAPENVCITISSDSEDESDSKPEVSTPTTESQPLKKTQSESDLDAETPKKKPRQENCAATTLVKVHPSTVKIVESTNPERSSDEDLAKVTLSVKVNSVRIGQLKLNPSSVLRLSHATLSMTAKSTHTGNDHILSIDWTSVTRCELCFDRREPCLYLTLQQGSLPQLREQLAMEKGKFPYYDPGGADDEKLFIVYINRTFLKSTCQNSVENLIRKIELIRKKLKKPTTFFCWIQFEESDERQTLAASVMEQTITPTEVNIAAVQASSDTKPESESPAPTENRVITKNQSKETSEDLKFMFTGPRKQLFVYPAPPVKGGISVTNEDQFCLNDGEFLNDVIIEFYLKYVYNKILSEEDRKRSHIFSCFFYERLMQKSKKLKGQSQAERRHNQVKKWTRNVDIFSKDFIFIPINEASHWYIAVICFPSMDRGKFEVRKEKDGDPTSMSNEQSEHPNVTSNSEGQLDSQGQGHQCTNSSDCNYASTKLAKMDASKVGEELDNCNKECETSEDSITDSKTKISSEKQKLISVNLPNFTLRRKTLKNLKEGTDSVNTKITSDHENEMTEPQNSSLLGDVVHDDETEDLIKLSEKAVAGSPLEAAQNVVPDGTEHVDSVVLTANHIENAVPENIHGVHNSEEAAELSSESLVEGMEGVVESSDFTEAPKVSLMDHDKSSTGLETSDSMEVADKTVPIMNTASIDTKSLVLHLNPAQTLEHPNSSNLHLDEKEDQLASGETKMMVSESNTENTLKPETVNLIPKSENIDSKEEKVSLASQNCAVSSDSNVDFLQNSERKNNLLHLFVSPGGPAFTLPKELEHKCCISPKRILEVRMDKVPNRSPIHLKYMRPCGTSDTPIKISFSSISSEDSVIVLSSSDHSDIEVCENSNESHSDMGKVPLCTGVNLSSTQANDCVKVHQNSDGKYGNRGPVPVSTTTESSSGSADLVNTPRSLEATPTTPLNLRFETSSHELSDCDAIMAESSHNPGFSPLPSDAIATTKTKYVIEHSERVIPPPGEGEDKEISTSEIINAEDSAINPSADLKISGDTDCINEKLSNLSEKDCSNKLTDQAVRSDSQEKDRTKTDLVPSEVCNRDSCSKGIGHEEQQDDHSKTDIPESSSDKTLGDCGTHKQGDTEGVADDAIDSAVTSNDNRISVQAADDVGSSAARETPTVDGNKAYKRSCILIFDSLRVPSQAPSRSRMCSTLREYLSMEWKTRKQSMHGEKVFDKDTMKMCTVAVPQQDNYTDCGLFLLHYVEKFFSNPITKFFIPIRLENWFSPEECKDKRENIKNLIDELHKDWVSRDLSS